MKDTKDKKDIFDRMMLLPVFKIFEPFYKKHKEVLLYLFFGGLAFVISISSYAFFYIVMDVNELIANVFSWILAVLFAYITNRTWVFEDVSHSGMAGIFKELVSFVLGRVTTLAVEEVILLIFITYLKFDSMLVKVVAQIVVIVLNYIISKLFVFKKK